MRKINCLIPARGGSTGIKDKNIKDFAGKPLIRYTIEAAQKSKHIDKIYVATDSNDIKRHCEDVNVLHLFPKFTGHRANIFNVYRFFQNETNSDEFIVLLATSPLKTAEDIDKSIELFFEKDADCVIGVTELEVPAAWILSLKDDGTVEYLLGNTLIKNRQDEVKSLIPNGTIYVMKSSLLESEKDTYYTDKTYPCFIPKSRSIDIDNLLDFKIAEFLYRENGINEKDCIEFWKKGYKPIDDYMKRNMDLTQELVNLMKIYFPNQKIFEIGCGPGRNLYELKKAGFEVAGCDVNPEFMRYANFLGLNVVNERIELSLPKEPYVLLSFGCMMHIHPDEFRRLKFEPIGMILFEAEEKNGFMYSFPRNYRKIFSNYNEIYSKKIKDYTLRVLIK